MNDETGINLYLIGDSTMSYKPDLEGPERGWGMMIPEYFSEDVRFHNFAINGRSSKSFIDEGSWQKVLDRINEGDYLFIQFGHNDIKIEDPARYTDPDKEYKANLLTFINKTREKKGLPILFTSICRRKFDAAGNLEDTHGKYPDSVREVAAAENVPLVDLEKKSRKVLLEHGVEESKKIFLWIEPGVYGSLPEGKEDNTHFSEYGARVMAGQAAEGLAELDLGLSRFVKK